MFSWDWLQQNIGNIFGLLIDKITLFITTIINALFDALDAVVNLLPSGSLVPSFTLPANAEFFLNGLNYFFDITAIASTIALVIATHIALSAVVAALRFIQVMK